MNNPTLFKESLEHIIASLQESLAGVRTNRPSPKLVEDIKVDYFGEKMNIKQSGSISIIPPREININLWDKNAVAATAKAIESSGLGLSANIDGNLIRLNLPALTEERRSDLIKLVKKISEESRIKIRSARDESNKKAKELPEDQKFKSIEEIQKTVDWANKEIETVVSKKISEINC